MKKRERAVVYRMPKAMYKSILAIRMTEQEKRMNPYKYVMNYLNSQGYLMGKVVSIQVSDV